MKISQRIVLNMTGIFTIASVILPCPSHAYDSKDLQVDQFQHFTSRPDFVTQSDRTLIVTTLTKQGLRLLERLNTDDNFFSPAVYLEAKSSIRIQVSYTGEMAVLLSVQPKRAIALESLMVSLAVVLIMLAAMLLVLLGLMVALVVVFNPSKQSILL